MRKKQAFKIIISSQDKSHKYATTIAMEEKKIFYICHYVHADEKADFNYADSALKKVQSMVTALESNGSRVTILSVATPKRAFFAKKIGKSLYQTRGMFYYPLRLLFQIKKMMKHMKVLYLKRKCYKTIISYSYLSTNVFLCCYGYIFLRKRVILDYEDGLYRHKTRFLYYAILEKIMLKISSGVIIVNRGLEERLPRGKKHVTVNGVFNLIDSNKGHIEQKEKKTKLSVLYSGELSFDYGLSLLLKIFASTGAGNMEFHITGAGPNENELLDTIKSGNLDNVIFHGYVSLERLKELEYSTDAFILCQNENSPIYRTNFPSKMFHFLSFYKPVFFNQCSLFGDYEEFENAFPINNVENGAEEIQKVLKCKEAYYPSSHHKMEQYNRDVEKKIMSLLS